LKGKYKPLIIVECINGYPELDLQLKIKTLTPFNLAMDYYQTRRFDQAIEIFQDILLIDSDDLAAEYYMNAAFKHARQGVPENWTGAEAMSSK